MNTDKHFLDKNYSITKIIILGLAPGAIMTLFGSFFASPLFGINLNVLLSIMLGFIFGKIPFCLAVLGLTARTENKKIREILFYNNKTPIKKLLPSVVIPLVIAIFSFVFILPIEVKLWGNLFDFFPDWFRLDKVNIPQLNNLKITLIITIIINGFIGPIVEEIYFRGFLLARMGIFGKYAPLVNMVIFSLYHFFTPWQNITRIIAGTPWVYSVWLNRNHKIGSYVHCTLNIAGDISLWVLLLGLF